MYIQDVLRFEKSGKEAELIVSDGAYEVLCYAYPIDAVKTGMTVSGLSGFSCTNVIRAAEQRCAVSKLPSYFAYSITGKLISRLYNKSRGVGKKDRQSKSDQVK